MKIPLHTAACLALFVSNASLPAADSAEVMLYNRILASVQPGQTAVELGDMTVPVRLVQAWRDKAMGLRGSSETFVDLWSGGTVYYAFESSVTEARRTHFRDACAEWAMFGNLTFTPRTTQTNYILVREDSQMTGGSSALGMIGGRQYFTMGTTSWNRVTLLHELGHALGLTHEHQRSDRDAYVQIITANITPGMESNFVRVFNTTNNTPYDFDSIMHYWNSALSVSPELETIVCRPGFEQHQLTMGRYLLDRWLSRGDQNTIAQLYGTGPALSAVVTNTKDSGPGSLRAAVYHTLNLSAEQPAVSPVITFQIPLSDPGYSGGVFTIRPTGRLPGPGARVTIDGTTQAAFTGDTNPSGPEIVISGELMTEAIEPGRAFILGDSHTVLRGLVIQGFSSAGLVISGDHNRVEGCYIGTSAAGTAAVANAFSGVAVNGGAGNNTIGPENVISGNLNHGVLITGTGTSANVVSGNRIGTNAAGTAALANGWSGVAVNVSASGNTIGPGNVISGNTNQGVIFNGSGTTGNTVTGNLIGTAAGGSAAIPNAWAGVAVAGGAAGNSVGPDNVISGNLNYGVLVTGTGSSGNLVTGNRIGTDATGAAALANAFAGAAVTAGAAGNTIGPGNVVSGNASQGVVLSGTGTSGNTVTGNLVGITAAGTAALPNAWSGVAMAGGAAGNVVGPNNVIGGNLNYGVLVNGTGCTGNAIAGNRIGTNAAGTTALANSWAGVAVVAGAARNTVGPGNVISGNANQGVAISAAGTNENIVKGNLIGLSAAGTTALPNAWAGVQIYSGAQGNMIGGLTPAERNIISGNTLQGLALNGTGTTGNLVRGNFIGTNAAGTAAVANLSPGVDVYGGASGNTIGGMMSGAGNVISGNAIRGVSFSGTGTDGNLCAGNVIGLNAAGTAAITNAGPGIGIFGAAVNTVIGGAGGGRNCIAGNSNSGVRISGAGTSGTRILGNSIGVTPGGAVVPNAGDGVEFFGGSANSVVGGSEPGAANLIRGNTRDGVGVIDAATVVSIERNSIYGNGGEGIDLGSNGVTPNDTGDGDTGANGLQNFPVLTSAVLGDGVTVAGTLNTAAGALVRVDFYASASGDEGQFHIGSISGTTTAGGTLTLNAVLPARVPAGYTITATATGPGNNTSEFSAPRTVTTTDSDSDGLPDVWESANGLNPAAGDAVLDLDSDGESNLAEFRAGTDPRNPASFLQLDPPVISAAGAVVSFTPVTGLTYRLESSPSLAPGSWQLLADQLRAGTSPLTLTDSSAAGLSRRFYRLTVVP